MLGVGILMLLGVLGLLPTFISVGLAHSVSTLMLLLSSLLL